MATWVSRTAGASGIAIGATAMTGLLAGLLRAGVAASTVVAGRGSTRLMLGADALAAALVAAIEPLPADASTGCSGCTAVCAESSGLLAWLAMNGSGLLVGCADASGWNGGWDGPLPSAAA